MKTKMNITRTCWALSAFVICLSSPPQLRGQTLPEQPMDDGYGFEPVVNCDRRTDSAARVQYVWCDGTAIYRRISGNLGENWGAKATLDSSGSDLDPFAACDIWSTDTTVPRIMYFGWSGSAGSTPADLFARSRSGTDVDSGPEVAESGVADRPWLAASSANLYLSFSPGINNPNNSADVKRAAIPTPHLLALAVPGELEPIHPGRRVRLLFLQLILIQLSGRRRPPRLHGGTEKVFLMARQHPVPGCFDSGGLINTNLIRIKRSLDQGATWQDEHDVDVTGADGFPIARDLRMLTYHITRDPRNSITYVYAFYVLNELVVVSPTQSFKRNVLYCMASLNGGKSWNGAQRCFMINQSDLPPNGFADVPANCDSPPSTAGFYRIGRVWSCVDDNGNVYVAWMDNRYGKCDDMSNEL